MQILVWKAVNYGRLEKAEKRMMVSEVNILHELQSPFVVKYLDRIVDRIATTLYVVMENCAGARARVRGACINVVYAERERESEEKSERRLTVARL